MCDGSVALHPSGTARGFRRLSDCAETLRTYREADGVSEEIGGVLCQRSRSTDVDAFPRVVLPLSFHGTFLGFSGPPTQSCGSDWSVALFFPFLGEKGKRQSRGQATGEWRGGVGQATVVVPP